MFITLTELVGFILHGQNLLFSKKIYFLFLLCSLLASNPFLFLHKIFVPKLEFTGSVKWLQFQFEAVFGDFLAGETFEACLNL